MFSQLLHFQISIYAFSNFRGHLHVLLLTTGLVPRGTCICSNVDTIHSWTCHVYGTFEFRKPLGTSVILSHGAKYSVTTSGPITPVYLDHKLERKFYENPYLMIPLCAGIVTLSVLIVAVMLYCKRRNDLIRLKGNITIVIFMSPDRMIEGILFLSCLSVCMFICLSFYNFNLRYYFWNLTDRDFIFDMHTQLMTPFQMIPRSMTMWPWLWPWS